MISNRSYPILSLVIVIGVLARGGAVGTPSPPAELSQAQVTEMLRDLSSMIPITPNPEKHPRIVEQVRRLLAHYAPKTSSQVDASDFLNRPLLAKISGKANPDRIQAIVNYFSSSSPNRQQFGVILMALTPSVDFKTYVKRETILTVLFRKTVNVACKYHLGPLLEYIINRKTEAAEDLRDVLTIVSDSLIECHRNDDRGGVRELQPVLDLLLLLTSTDVALDVAIKALPKLKSHRAWPHFFYVPLERLVSESVKGRGWTGEKLSSIVERVTKKFHDMFSEDEFVNELFLRGQETAHDLIGVLLGKKWTPSQKYRYETLSLSISMPCCYNESFAIHDAEICPGFLFEHPALPNSRPFVTTGPSAAIPPGSLRSSTKASRSRNASPSDSESSNI